MNRIFKIHSANHSIRCFPPGVNMFISWYVGRCRSTFTEQPEQHTGYSSSFTLSMELSLFRRYWSAGFGFNECL